MDTQQHKKFNILLVGDSGTDEYRFGVVDRISPEAPVPIFNYRYKNIKPGMAANVRDNLAALGCEVISFLGPESIKTRLIDMRSHQQILRIDKDATHIQTPLNGQYLNFNKVQAVVISDYNKGYITYELIKEIQDRYNGPIFLDTKKTDLARFSKCFIKINSNEFDNRTSDGDNVIVTLGRKGTKWKEKIYPTEDVAVSDVCGAGDSFLAALVYFYLSEGSIEKAIPYANKAGAITVQHLGTYAPTLKEIYEA